MADKRMDPWHGIVPTTIGSSMMMLRSADRQAHVVRAAEAHLKRAGKKPLDSDAILEAFWAGYDYANKSR